MGVVSQVAADAPTSKPTGISQCKPPTAETITLCWTASTISGVNVGNNIKSYKITNATETCENEGAARTCTFGNYALALTTDTVANFLGGTNATGGTGSDVTSANFTKLSPGAVYRFIIYGENNHGTSAASDPFIATTSLVSGGNYANPDQVFGNGTNFGNETEFAANQDFTLFQNFGIDQTFGSGTGFAQDQTFNGTQDFSAGNIKFDSGTQFADEQIFGIGANFTGATTFKGANTFGDSAKFGTGADFSIGNAIQTFGDSGNFSGIAKFGTGKSVFGASTLFAAGQPFVGEKDFSAASIGFGSGTTFDVLQTFGSGANFTGAATFTGANTFGVNAVFGDASVFPAGQSFGKGANFTGKMTFSGDQTFPQDAEFAAGQTFAEGTTFNFDEFAMFNAGTVFGKARTFDVGTQFDSTMTFYENMAFGASTKFGDEQVFNVGTMQFAMNQMFGANTDFTNDIQTFYEGTTFGVGTTFAVNTIMPKNSVPSAGLMLTPFTCLDAACVPPAISILAPGEFLTPGTDPTPILTSLTSSDPSISIPGLGFVMNFTTVSGTGSTSVDPIDPDALPGSTGAVTNGAAGSKNVATASGQFDTIGMALDISAGTATVSGDIQITMPYDDTVLASGVTEADLVVLHYIAATETWEEVSNCTIDAAANNITCTGITSLSPFSIGAGTTGGNPGGMDCDTNAYGNGKSMAIHEITWDVEEANEVQVIASSKCGPVQLKVFTQQSIATGGLAQEQPYLADNKVVMRAPVQHTVLDVSASQSFRVVVENGWNSFDQTIYTDLHGSSGTLLLNFQKQDYSHVRLFIDDEPQLAAAPSYGMFMDPEPQLVMEAIDHTILRPNYDAEPQLTPAEMEIWASTYSDAEPQLTEQEKQMSFLDWLFSLFS